MMKDVPIVGWDVTFTPKGIFLLEVRTSTYETYFYFYLLYLPYFLMISYSIDLFSVVPFVSFICENFNVNFVANHHF